MEQAEPPLQRGPPDGVSAEGPLHRSSAIPPGAGEAAAPFQPQYFPLVDPVEDMNALADRAAERMKRHARKRHPGWTEARVTGSVAKLLSGDIARRYFVEREAYLDECAARMPTPDEQRAQRELADQLLEDTRAALRQSTATPPPDVTPSDEQG